MSCKDGENKSDPLIDSIRDGLLELYHNSKKVMAETRDENGYEYPRKEKPSSLFYDINMVLMEDNNDLNKEQIRRLMPVVKKWIEKAIDECSGYYTDVEYVTGKSKEEFFKDHNL